MRCSAGWGLARAWHRTDRILAWALLADRLSIEGWPMLAMARSAGKVSLRYRSGLSEAELGFISLLTTPMLRCLLGFSWF